MDNGFGTQDILTGRGLGLAGFGYGYDGAYASIGANAVRSDRNGQFIENQADCTREVLSANINAARDSFENLTRENSFANIKDSIVGSEFRTSDRLRDIEREMNANAREAAKCCCDLKSLIASENSATRELINQNLIQKLTDTNNINATVGAINAAASQNTAAIVEAIRSLCNRPGNS